MIVVCLASLDDARAGGYMEKVIEGVLDKFNDPTQPPGLEPAYSIQQLITHYGCSESFWRKELHKGKLRYFKLGALTRISQSALAEYLAARERV
jgi:excisionase family DNA binding protein